MGWETFNQFHFLEQVSSVIRTLQKQPLEVFYKKRCSQKIGKIHRKTPLPEPQETLAQVFSCEFCEISKTTLFTEHLRWHLLTLQTSMMVLFTKIVSNVNLKTLTILA